MEINVEPGTIPQVVVYGSITAADVSSVYVDGDVSSVGVDVIPVDTAITVLRLNTAVNADQIIQFFVQNSPVASAVLSVVISGSPAISATINNLESNYAKLEEKTFELMQQVQQLQRGVESVSRQLYMLNK